MQSHPIHLFMEKSLENFKKMIDVNTIIGDAVETKNGTIIIPVTKVSYGFAAGGSDYGTKKEEDYPFGGGSGGGVTIYPIGFLIVSPTDTKFQLVDRHAIWERLIDEFPEIAAKIKDLFSHPSACYKPPTETTIIFNSESKEQQ